MYSEPHRVQPAFDLAIVGAGLVGAMAAYFAATANVGWRVLVLDRSLMARGATSYSSGLEHPYGLNPRHRELALRSGRVYERLLRLHPGLPIFELPLYGIVSRGAVGDALARYTHPRVRPGGPADAAALTEGCPGLRLVRGDAVLSIPGVRYGLAAGVATTLLAAAVDRGGARVWEGARVVGVQARDGGLVVALADGRMVAAARVLDATGPWVLGGPAARAARAAGVRLKKIVALHVEARPPPDAPAVFFLDHDSYLLPQRDLGRWIFSFPSAEWDCEPEISRLWITAQDRELGTGILSRFAPRLAARCSGGRVFCDAYTSDRTPIVRDVPGTDRFVMAGACSGYGYRLAPALALEALARLGSGRWAEQGRSLAGSDPRQVPTCT